MAEPILAGAWNWLTDPANWSGSGGIGMRIAEHLGYTATAMAVACAIAIPLGTWIGHTGRGRTTAVALTGALRALPTLGLLTYLALTLPGGATAPIIPAIAVLVLMAVPPVLAGTYSGFESVGADTVDAAYAVGHSTRQVVLDVEFPLGLPVILGGVRSALLQVIATATVAAYVGLGGLGRYLLDALAVRDYGMMLGAALLIAVLALVVDRTVAAAATLARRRSRREVKEDPR